MTQNLRDELCSTDQTDNFVATPKRRLVSLQSDITKVCDRSDLQLNLLKLVAIEVTGKNSEKYFMVDSIKLRNDVRGREA